MNDQPNNPFPAIVEGPALTMSSREIAELTGKEHSNVSRDIRQMLVSLYGDDHVAKIVPEQYRNRHSEFIRENAGTILEAIFPQAEDASNWNDPGRGFKWERDNRGYIVAFHLDRSHTYSLIAGYDVKLRKRIIDRWLELEAKAAASALPDFSDPAVLTHLLLEHAGKRIEAEQRAAEAETQIGQMMPKVEAHDRIAEAHGTFCRMTAAKMLGVPPHTLIRWLRTNGWTYRRPGDKDDLAYQSKMQAGLLDHKVTTGERPDGTDWTSTQVRVTAKGLTVLAKAFPPAVAEVPSTSRRGLVAGLAGLAAVGMGFAIAPPRKAMAFPAPDRDGLATMQIGSETVLVDTARFKAGADDPVAVLNHDGSIAVRYLSPDDGRPTYGQGKRFAMAAPRDPVPGQDPRGALSVSDGVWVIGAVVGKVA